MRTLLILWFGPILGFWVWHLLATDGIYFSRELHDEIFRLYGELLGIDPGTIPSMFAKALATDMAIVALVVAYRKRRAIASGLRLIRAKVTKADPALLEG